MKVIDITIDRLREAPWNPNQMDGRMLSRLRESVRRYGLVQGLVVRPADTAGWYEVLSGNQRIQVLRDMSYTEVPCVVVDVDDAHAHLLTQALNQVHGEDDLGLKAEAMRKILEVIPEEEVLLMLPETSRGLQALASLGKLDMARHLQEWQSQQGTGLKHLQFQLTPAQLEVVHQALGRVAVGAEPTGSDSPNARGTALYTLCRTFLDMELSTDDDR